MSLRGVYYKAMISLGLKEIKEIFATERAEDICLVAVRRSGMALEHVEKQTKEICLAAVRQDWRAIKFVKDQTEEMCLLAAVQDGMALRYVKSQTEEICLTAVKHNGWALQFVENQTDEICLAAVKGGSGGPLQFVKNITEEICLAAVKHNGWALQFVENQTEEICLAAVNENGTSLQFVGKQNDDICSEAIKENPVAIMYVKNGYNQYSVDDIEQAFNIVFSYGSPFGGDITMDELNILTEKSVDTLLTLSGDELINAVDVKLKHVLKNSRISKLECAIGLVQKVELLKSIKSENISVSTNSGNKRLM